jgi:quercetin dioxygenase-like cupin family protein
MTCPGLSARLGRASLSNSGWYLDQLITFLAIGDDTAGRFALLRVHGTQGVEPGAHVHTQEDETIYLLEGELTVTAGGEELQACPGDTVTIPRGVAHAVRHDSREVRFLVQFSPAGFERYFHEMSEPAEYLGLPPRPAPPDHARMQATAARYGCVFTDRDPS